jgi:hypothetical protein
VRAGDGDAKPVVVDEWMHSEELVRYGAEAAVA